jgi:carbamoyl-phosphate synthase large subunit
MRVAVTAAGGGVGQSILKALKDSKYEAVAIDPSPLAVGLYFTNKAYIGKNYDDKKFIDRLIEICHKEKCKYLFSGLDAELIPLSDPDNFKKMCDQGIRPIISDPLVIKISDDKYELSNFLKENGFPYIKTVLSIPEADEVGLQCPVVVKPKEGGCRSQKVKICNTFQEVDQFMGEYPDETFVIQEWIEGDEYTCGTVTFNKDVKGVIMMRRQLRDGDTYKAYVEDHKQIKDFLYSLLPEINPFGPCNIQLRIKDNVPYVFEINARCSGTTGARALAGFNEPVMVCDFLEGKDVNYSIKNIAILRYWNECVVNYSEIEELDNEGFIHRGKGFFR